MVGVLFLIYFHCLLVCDVWSVAYEQFGDFAAVEEYQDPELYQVLAAFPLNSYSNMHFNYIVVYYCYALN
jgi:hypothetical protein